MVAKSVKWVLAGLIVSPSAALALGLGDIHLNSTLNAPLDANIDLVGATPDELATLTPKIASRETFAQHGLDWPAFLANVTVRAVHAANGRDVLQLRSTEPVTEPFLTLLVELDWDRGHFVREYTVLLDPPVYTPNAGRVAHESIEAPTTGAAVNQGLIRRSASGAGASSAGTEPAAGAAPASGSGTDAASQAGAAARKGGEAPGEAGGAGAGGPTYTVRPGDTLSRIAGKLGERADENRWMVATYEANQAAFNHNMNLLRSGAVLRIPSGSAIDAISTAQASVEVHRQYAAWRGSAGRTASTGEQPGRLRLVAPSAEAGTPGTAGAGTSASGGGSEVKSLQDEVQSLQTQLAESRRLLDLRNAELAQLQSKLAAKESAAEAIATGPAATHSAPGTPAASQASAAAGASGEPAGAAAAAATSAASGTAASAGGAQSAAAPPATASNPPSASSAGAQAAAQNAPAASQSAARRPARRPLAAAAHPAPESSWLDLLGSFGWVLVAAVLALVGFLGFRIWNSRRKAGFDDSLGRLAEAGATPRGGTPSLGGASPFGEVHGEPEFPQTAPQMAPKREASFLVEESGSHERPRFENAEAAAAAPHVEADDTISSETAINLDQGDPLAEADFHMAYGLYDQAADLVRIAIQREPQRRDLRLKLLEVFFVWGNKEQFLATARELAETRAAAAPGEWEKILIMGKQLAPDDPLFAGGAAVSGAAAGGVDLDLQGGEQGVDFDILGGAPVEAGSSDSVDLDIGSAIGARDPAAEAAAHQATDRNLTLDEGLVLPEESTAEREVVTATQQMLGADASTGSTREMTARTREMTAVTREMTATLERDMTWDAEEAAPEGPTVEQPALEAAENPTIRQKVEMALRAGTTEHTTELALDDLGLDLTELAPAPEATRSLAAVPEAGHDTIDQPAFAAASDAPTLVAGLDEHSRRVLEAAGRRAGAADGELKVSETGTWHFDADPFAAEGEGSAQNGLPAGDLSDTSRLAALKGGSVDFEIGEPAPVARTNGSGHVDLDVGTATVPDAAFTATQRLGAEDLALPDLDPVTMSEVGTKLDLARAYMDMGDPEGARNILEEVMNEGSVTQKQEAERLIASLPG